MSVALLLPPNSAVPREAVPFRKLTEPVGVAPPVAVTVAVSVSVWPTDKLVADAESVVVVGSPMI